MAELYYHCTEKIDLNDIQKCAIKIGIRGNFVVSVGQEKLYFEELIDGKLNWIFELTVRKEDLFGEIFDSFKRELKVMTVIEFEFNYSNIDTLRMLLSCVMQTYNGWFVDDIAPNFETSTKGKYFYYFKGNIEDFGK
ncbi:MAG: hypothetical protein Phog2KO_43690 [Phototrophicaceae bacterium]